MTDRRTVTLDPADVVIVTAGTREALHASATRLYELARARAAAAGDKVDTDSGEVVPRLWRLTFSESEDDRTLLQNAFYFGVVLKQISEQAAPGGQRWTADAYHELAKRQFLGYEVVKKKVAGRKRPVVIRRLRSTTGLSVKQMSDYLDKVIAFAVADLGVVFDFDQNEREAVRYVRPARKQRQPAAEAA